MTEEEITREAYKLANRLESVNQEYIELLCTQLGELKDVDIVNYVALYEDKDKNIKRIQKSLQTECNNVAKLSNELYAKQASEVYDSMRKFYLAKQLVQVPFYRNYNVLAQVRAISQLTNNAFRNISNTTAVDMNYQSSLDKAILAVQSGADTYQSQLRKVISDSSIEGLRVHYASGLTRRIDSAARMNILQGVRQINEGVHRICGEEFGADGMEISAHGLCAEDHLPYQGRQYTLARYDELNGELQRPIGTLNCQHTARPIVLGVSQPTYTEEQLQEINDYSTEKISIGDKEYTRYQCSQLMRNLETQVRTQKDLLIGAKFSNDTNLQLRAKNRIKALKSQYKKVASSAGLKERPYRMSVPSRTPSYVKKAQKSSLQSR